MVSGVLSVEIHPTQPKVTVIGDVDIGVLIKKLSKVGKSVEVLDETTQKPQEKANPEYDKSNKSSIDTGKKNESKNSKNKEDNDGKSKEGEGGPSIVTAIPRMSLCPTVVPQAQVYYPVEPIVVPMPYYAMTVHPTPVTYYVQDYRYYETLAYRPQPSQLPAMTTFGDYFDEDNTMGCRIMWGVELQVLQRVEGEPQCANWSWTTTFLIHIEKKAGNWMPLL